MDLREVQHKNMFNKIHGTYYCYDMADCMERLYFFNEDLLLGNKYCLRLP